MNTKHALKLILQSAIYLVLVFFLLREVDETATIEECTGFDAPPKALARADYDFLIRYGTFQEPSNRRVIEVVLDPQIEPDEIISNYCTQREFTARVIDRLNELQVSVIALDKIYKRKRCTDDDPGTSKLQDAIRRSRAVIIRGIDTELIPETRVKDQKVCLRLTKSSYLSLDVADEASGLLRMDPNTKLAPLTWPVRVIDEENNETIEDLPTLSFVTARAAEYQAVQNRLVQRAIRIHQQPYSTRVSIPVFSAARVLCGLTYTMTTDWRNCKSGEQLRELRDAVVIFGDHVRETDWHQGASHSEGLYGIDLQANFVAAILDKRCYLPLFSTTSNLVLVGGALFMLHICFHFFKPLWRTFLIAIVIWIIVVGASFIILGLTGYLLTTWVQGVTLTTIFVTTLHHWSTTQD